MIIISDRIRAVRKHFQLSQAAFGKKIAIAQNTIASYETGRREPSKRVLLSICRYYGVSEPWLMEGIGDMILPQNKQQALANWAGQLVDKGLENDFVARLVAVVATLSTEELAMLEHIASRLAGNEETAPEHV